MRPCLTCQSHRQYRLHRRAGRKGATAIWGYDLLTGEGSIDPTKQAHSPLHPVTPSRLGERIGPTRVLRLPEDINLFAARLYLVRLDAAVYPQQASLILRIFNSSSFIGYLFRTRQ